MKRISMLAAILVCTLSLQVAFAQNSAKPMTNSDVIDMVKAGLPEGIILSAIEAQPTQFDNSAGALVELTKNGVSTRVIGVMLAASRKTQATPQAPTAPTAPAVPPAPVVTAPPPSPAAAQPAVAPAPAVAPSVTPPQEKSSKGGFLNRLNQAQTQVNGAVQQTTGSLQQTQATARQAQDAGKQATQGFKPAASGTTTTPAAARPQQPAPVTAPAAPTAAQQAQTERAAALQQQRQQQLAAQQKLQEQMTACRTQATSIDPQMRSPEAQKAYASCVQSVVQAQQANRPK